ncbi:MAG: DUF1361 domain-containing protein [Cellulomonadaceae bacterium]|jgi:uncharacterized membrane protein|nr:DUF1361 domain-containing protein [Cellulomonadaceae bacterium]
MVTDPTTTAYMTAIGNAIVLLPLGLIALNFYALALVVARGPVFHTRIYKPMILNIGLSLTPALVAALTLITMVIVGGATGGGWPVVATIVVGGIIWLLLLPNAAYLVTELNFSHRRDGENVPLWYDIMLVLTLAMSGVLNTLANVAIAQLIYTAFTTPSMDDYSTAVGPWIFTVVVMVAVAFGIYLGRYIRFNSWDLAHLVGFVRKLVGHFRLAANARAAAGFVLTHTLFLALLYAIVVAPWLLVFIA